jgi:hypothetical protein
LTIDFIERGLNLSRRRSTPAEAGVYFLWLPTAAVAPAFYESDCQGRFSSSLIAFRFFPLQSALTDRFATIVRTRGWAEQSFASDSSSVSPLIFIETISSGAVDHR